MRIESNVTVYAGGDIRQEEGPAREKERQSGSKTVYAGDLRRDLSLRDRIAQKKEEARKQAFKLVGDAWDGDRAVDRDLDDRRAHIDELRQTLRQEQDKLSEIDAERETLRETYGVAEGSEEEQELALLRKRGRVLSEEEQKEIARIEERGLSDYQKRQLELDQAEAYHLREAGDSLRQIETENAVIRGTKQERLKYHKMTDAQIQADEILEAAGDSIIGMVVEEAKEHLDEEQEKREQEAESIQEAKEERQEFIESQKEKRDEAEELVEEIPVDEMLELDRDRTDVRQEVENIVNKLGLIAEEIKGSVVDKSV